MKSFPARHGPFREQLQFSTAEIDEMCVDALQQVTLLPATPGAVRIERFIEKRFKCTVRYEDLGDRVMGCTVFRENGEIEAVIVSNRLEDGRDISERRIRSTLAHEGGHCLMHPILFMKGAGQRTLGFPDERHENLDFKTRRILCRDEDIIASDKKRSYDRRWWEWQANRAIGGLLLPKAAVREVMGPFLVTTSVTRSTSLPATIRESAAREVARVFEVNPVVARIRLQELFPEDGAQMTF